MYSSFFKIYIFLAIILIFFSYFTISFSNNSNIQEQKIESQIFYWPLPGNHKITSKFGKRTAPTNGASSYHSGIDIAATEGTPIYACFPGLVTFIGFKGAGGYTITIKNDSITASYCHVSPNYLFKTGDYVTSQSIIAHIGPKYVYNIINNPYKDSSGKPTNGATTGCHLHLTIKKDGKAVNPLNYF